MDNRRLSARAEVSAGGRPRTGSVPAPAFLDRAVELTRLNWEVLVFAGLLLLAVFTRLWDLGQRAMHHDESIHAYFSNWFLKSGDYTTTAGFNGGYDPTYHGPLLYHLTGFGFWLFGTTDATARLMPAIFGIMLVGLCWFMRPFIGRIGAIIAALLIVLSPSIAYYSRSLRHDIFSLFGMTLLFVSILWFVRTHQPRWAFLGSLGLVISYSSHELTYLVAFIFVLFLLLAAFLYPAFSVRDEYNAEDANPVRSALSSLATQRWTLLGAALIFLGVYAVLFTNWLTKPQLILSGITEGLEYWLGEHEVARGNQPRFYYLLLMFFYELLALVAGLGTVVYMISKWVRRRGDVHVPGNDIDVPDAGVTDEYGYNLPRIEAVRGFALAFLAFWAFGALISFSLAGERMPWLVMQTALPFTLLASAGLGRLIARMEWREAWKGGGAFLGVAVLLFIFSAFSLIAHLRGDMPAPIGTSAEAQALLRGVLLVLFTGGLLALCGWLAYKMLPGRAVKVIGLTFALVLALYGLRSMTLANYRHGDVPIEMLVYTQSAPDVPIVADLIKRLSRDETAFSDRNATDVTGGNSLVVAIDQQEAIEWPFDWYFRDMKKLSYFNSQAQRDQGLKADAMLPPSAPVILVSEAYESDASFQAFIKDKYTTQKYVLNWWFPEEAYKVNNEGDLGAAITWLQGNLFKYLLYRDPGLPLGSRNFFLHVRNDLAVKAGLTPPSGTAAAPPSGTAPSETGPVYGMLELAPQGVERGQFRQPRGIATGPDGSFYVADTGNLRLQKFDSTGKFVALIGAGQGTGDGQFEHLSKDIGARHTGPGGIAVDKAGNIYVADTWNHRIQKFDKDGKFLAKWGDFINISDPASAGDPARDTKFYGPRGVAIGPDGNVYVTDTGNKRVQIFDPNGKYLRQINSNVTPERIAANDPFNKPGEMNEPIGIAVDGQGNVYVADTNNKRIQKFDPAGKAVAQWPVQGNNWMVAGFLEEPFLALDGQGNLYATAPSGQKVIKYSPTGQVLGEKSQEGPVTLRKPTGITVAPDGNIYVVDVDANGVVKLGAIAP